MDHLNPELRPGEAPLADLLADAASDVDDAVAQFTGCAVDGVFITATEPRATEVAEAGISLGNALAKVVAILRDEAQKGSNCPGLLGCGEGAHNAHDV